MVLQDFNAWSKKPCDHLEKEALTEDSRQPNCPLKELGGFPTLPQDL